jgi:hypothetical protein
MCETTVVPRAGAPVFPYADEANFTLPSLLAQGELLIELWDRRPEGDKEGEGANAGGGAAADGEGEGDGGGKRKGSKKGKELTVEEERAEEERKRLACVPGRGIGAGDHSLGCVRLRGVELLQYTNTTAADLARMGTRAPTANDAKKQTEPLAPNDAWEGSKLARKACKGTPEVRTLCNSSWRQQLSSPLLNPPTRPPAPAAHSRAPQPVTGKLSFKMWELTMPEDITIPLDPHQRHLPNRDPVRRLSLAGIPPRPLLLRSKLTPQEVRSMFPPVATALVIVVRSEHII